MVSGQKQAENETHNIKILSKIREKDGSRQWETGEADGEEVGEMLVKVKGSNASEEIPR